MFIKVRENRLRRMANRQGYRLMKSRTRDPLALTFGGYMLCDLEHDGVVCGSGNAGRGFAADLDEIEAFLRWDTVAEQEQLHGE